MASADFCPVSPRDYAQGRCLDDVRVLWLPSPFPARPQSDSHVHPDRNQTDLPRSERDLSRRNRVIDDAP